MRTLPAIGFIALVGAVAGAGWWWAVGKPEWIAKETVRGALKDPESAQFRNLRRAPGPTGRYICGQVNAKNAMGGYAGFHLFAVVLPGEGNDEPVLVGPSADPSSFPDSTLRVCGW